MEEKRIKALKQRDEAAFKSLFDDYGKIVFHTCLGIVHDEDDANDVSQEVFIEAFHSIQKFRADSKLSTWLYRIAINKSLNFVRNNKRMRMMQSIGLTKTPDIADEEYNYDLPYEAILEKQRKKIIHAAIDALPGNQKSAFVLSQIDDLSYKEIAEVLNVSLSSVESLIFRARKNLQKKLLNCYKKSC